MTPRTKELCLQHLREMVKKYSELAEHYRLDFYNPAGEGEYIKRKRERSEKLLKQYETAVKEIENTGGSI